MLLPKTLSKGDAVGVIAPASPPGGDRLQSALPFLESMGLQIKLGKSIERVHGYLAGTDKERLEDFHDMVADEQVKAIFFARGGYGSGRIAAAIDYQLVATHPKIIWGYSDITYLHTAIRQKTGLVTFHGPMLSSDVADSEFDALSASMFQQLFTPMTLKYDEAISELEVLVEGVATGQLVGGNLSVLVSTLGTEFEIDTAGNILLLEDIDEVPYRVDSMLNQLKLAGKFNHLAGVMIGDFANAEPKKLPSLTLKEVFYDYFSNLACPVMAGFKIGHCYPHFAVPLGGGATMVTDKKRVYITPGVTST